MAIVKILSSHRNPKAIQRYLEQPTKTTDSLLRGYQVDACQFGRDFIETQQLYGKTDGRRYYHIIVSLPPAESSHISPEKMTDLSYHLGMDTFGKNGYEFVAVTHTDTSHLHAHIVCNSVNLQTGKKLHFTKHNLAKMKERFSELCQEAGLSQVPTTGRHRANGEYWVEQHGKDSWKKELRDVIDLVRKKATSYADFKEILKTEWEIVIDRDNGKGMTYHHPNGNKVRGKKLGTEYDKPAILAVLEQQRQKQERPRKHILGTKRPKQEELQWH